MLKKRLFKSVKAHLSKLNTAGLGEEPIQALSEFKCHVCKGASRAGEMCIEWTLGSTYMCEVSFAALTHIKTRQRNRLNVESSRVTAVATLSPELSELMKDKQAPVAH